ncbi:hypothetical protein HanRHA438_Chr02g0061971 [Helianthus annuus]|nr:hypothetical protein HanPI659440_Chr02g0045511 [Helianthus annuus]KAJ0939512.1 hypothetical protein HanRHA438_Chr02g0061971 [Helianthus annuus]
MDGDDEGGVVTDVAGVVTRRLGCAMGVASDGMTVTTMALRWCVRVTVESDGEGDDRGGVWW